MKVGFWAFLVLVLASASAMGAPTATLSSDTQVPGGSVSLSASGFPTAETFLDVSFDGERIALFSVKNGRMTARDIAVPTRSAPGLHTVSLIGGVTKASVEVPLIVTFNWPQSGHDGARTGAADDSVISPNTVRRMGLERIIRPGGAVSAPILYKRQLITATRDGRLVSFSVDGWKSSWERSVAAAGAPVAAADKIFVLTKGMVLLALDPLSGQERGRIGLSVDDDVATLAAYGDYVFVQGSGGLTAIGAMDLKPKWKSVAVKARKPGGLLASPAGLVATNGTSFFALDIDSGAVVAKAAATGAALDAFLNGRVYARDRHHVPKQGWSLFRSISPLGGNAISFVQDRPFHLAGPPVYVRGDIFVQMQDSASTVRMFRFDQSGGKPRQSWAIDQGRICGAFATTNGVLFCTAPTRNGRDSDLYAYSSAGDRLFSFHFASHSDSRSFRMGESTSGRAATFTSSDERTEVRTLVG